MPTAQPMGARHQGFEACGPSGKLDGQALKYGPCVMAGHVVCLGPRVGQDFQNEGVAG